MRLTLLLLLAFLASTSGVFSQNRPVQKIVHKIGGRKVEYWIQRFDVGRYEASFCGMSVQSGTGVSPLECLSSKKVDCIIGSGFVKRYFPLVPDGLLKVNRIVLNPFKKGGYGALVGIYRGRIIIVPASLAACDLLESGFQVGPLLINNGRPSTTKMTDNRDSRSFIAIDGKGGVLVGTTASSITLTELMIDFLTSSSFNFNVKYMANLCGGGGEVFMARAKANDLTLRHFGNSNASLEQTGFLMLRNK